MTGAAPVAVRLVLPAGPAIDPFALAGPDGILVNDGSRILVGLGPGLPIELTGGVADGPSVAAVGGVLRSVSCDDRAADRRSGRPGSGVVAFGALPFDRHRPAAVEVPGLTYCREPDGAEWVTVLAADRAGLPDPDDPAAAGRVRARLIDLAGSRPQTATGHRHVTVEPRSGDEEFLTSVAAAVAAIHRRELEKVVLARTVDVRWAGDLDLPDLLRRWSALEPGSTVFSLPGADGRFVGASPELLVERSGDAFRCVPLAGTTSRHPVDAGGMPTALLDSGKDAEEHRLVVEYIRQALAPHAAALTVPDHPVLIHLHNLTHLGTTIDGSLRVGPGGRVPTALELSALLHPTPAVAGVPLQPALDLIEELESAPRGSYAGPVGWVDASGDGRWVVGIRALTVGDAAARLTAGVGIVSGSIPEVELAETRLKLNAVLDALRPPAGAGATAAGPDAYALTRGAPE